MNENGRGREVSTLNRGLVVLRPRGPFVEWAGNADPEAGPSGAERTRSTPAAFLIPDFASPDHSWQWIEENCSFFFELELSEWDEDEQRWPRDRGWTAFQEWFDIEFIDTMWDLVDEPLSSDAPGY